MLYFRPCTPGTTALVERALFGHELGELVSGAGASATQSEGDGRQTRAGEACKNDVGADCGYGESLLRCWMGAALSIARMEAYNSSKLEQS